MSTSTLADFEILEQLGKGSYGTVFKVKRTVDNRLYVLKQIPLGSLSPKEQNDCISEVQLLASLDSEWIVRYYDSFIDQQALNIVMELCEQGDLHQLLKRQKSSLLPEDTIWSYFIQTLLGLHALHSRKILHRDVKTMNLFLTSVSGRSTLKIGDLGVAKMLGSQSAFAHTTVGTPYYLSPELCEGKPYNEKSDVWAAGVVLYELCTLKHPFDASNQGALILKIMKGKYPSLPACYAATKLQRVLDACLRKDTNLRPTVTQVLASQSVYSKAKMLGFADVLPPQVEELVESRKYTKVIQPPPRTESVATTTAAITTVPPSSVSNKRPVKARSQALGSHHIVPSSSSNYSAASSNPLTRTSQLPRRQRTRMGASSMVIGPVVTGVAPARPPKGLMLRKPPPPTNQVNKLRKLEQQQIVQQLPDDVLGALVASSSSVTQSGQPSTLASNSASQFASTSSQQQPLLSTAHFITNSVSPLNDTNTSLVCHLASQDASFRSTYSSDPDHEHSSNESTSHSQPTSTTESNTEVDDEVAPLEESVLETAFASSNLTNDDRGVDDFLESDLVDTTHEDETDGYDLSGTSDEVKWRILENEQLTGDAEATIESTDHEVEDPERDLYDDEEDEIDERITRDEDVSHQSQDDYHTVTAGSNTTRNSTPPPLVHHPHHTDPHQVLHALQARSATLSTRLDLLRAEVIEQIGEDGYEKLYQYFESSDSNAPTASTSPDHAFTRRFLSDIHAHTPTLDLETIFCQILYLESEQLQCQQMAHTIQTAAVTIASQSRLESPVAPDARLSSLVKLQ